MEPTSRSIRTSHALLRDPYFRANRIQRAAIALRIPCRADFATVMDQPVRELDPFRLWNDLHEVLFHFFGRLGPREAQPVRQPKNMGVHDNAGSNAVGSP